MTYSLTLIIPAAILCCVALAIADGRERLANRKNEIRNKLTYLTMIKLLILFFGLWLGFSLFWKGFGVMMCATNNDPSWITGYVFAIWALIPILMLAFFFPRLGALLLLGDAGFCSFLLIYYWHGQMSLVTEDNIFVAYKDHYNLALTVLSLAGPFVFLGLFFGWVGQIEKKRA